MDWIAEFEEILSLADSLPSGRLDLRCEVKLAGEWGELLGALDEDDFVEAALEVADIMYYEAKCVFAGIHSMEFAQQGIEVACQISGISVADAFAICKIKYGLRARPGNPKHPVVEREAVSNYFLNK